MGSKRLLFNNSRNELLWALAIVPLSVLIEMWSKNHWIPKNRWQMNFPPSPKQANVTQLLFFLGGFPLFVWFNQSGYVFCVAEIRYRELPSSHCPRCSRVELSRKAGKKKLNQFLSICFGLFAAFFKRFKKGAARFFRIRTSRYFFVGTLEH